MLCFLLSFHSLGQSDYLDSLQARIDNEQLSDSLRLNAFKFYVLGTLYENTEEQGPVLADYLAMARQVGDTIRICHAYHCYGFSHQKLGNLDSAGKYFDACLREAQSAKIYYYIANAYIDLAGLAEAGGHYNEALEGYQLALDSAIAFREPVIEARARINMGLLYNQKGEYILGLEHLQKALERCEQGNMVGFMASTLRSLGDINATIGQYQEAKDYFERALVWSDKRNNLNTKRQVLQRYARLELENQELMAGKQLLFQLLELAQAPHLIAERGEANMLLAEMYANQDQLDSANYFIRQSLALLESLEGTQLLFKAYGVAGSILLQEGKQREARSYCQRSYDMYNASLEPEQQMANCWCLYQLSKDAGQPQLALQYHEEYTTRAEQLNDRDQVRDIVRMQLTNQYERERYQDSLMNQQNLAMVELQHNQALSERERVIAWGIGGMVMLGIFLAVLIRAYRQNRRQKEDLEQMDKLNKQIFSIISHDFRGPLMSMELMAGALEKSHLTEQELQLYAQDIKNQVGQTSNILENLLNWARAELQINLMDKPSANPRLITEEIKQSFEEKLATKKLSLANHLPEELTVNLHPDLLRIVLRNLLSNAIKYSHVQGVITVRQETDAAIVVNDQGVGMPADKVEGLFKAPVFSQMGTQHETGFGIGLYITSELLRKIGWQLAVDSRPNQGTSFRVSPQ